MLQFIGSQRVGHDWATKLNGYKNFSTTLNKVLKRIFKTDGEIGKHKLNEIGTLNIKQKQTR